MKNTLTPGTYSAKIESINENGTVTMLIYGNEITFPVGLIKPIKKEVFTYTTEQLCLLQEVYLSGFEDVKDPSGDDIWCSPKALQEFGVKGFTNWLMQEDRTKLL